jgi:hypothetical protein
MQRNYFDSRSRPDNFLDKGWVSLGKISYWPEIPLAFAAQAASDHQAGSMAEVPLDSAGFVADGSSALHPLSKP